MCSRELNRFGFVHLFHSPSSALLAWSRKRGHTQNSEQRKVLVRTKALVLHVHYRACTAHGCATTPELLVSDIPVRLACKQ